MSLVLRELDQHGELLPLAAAVAACEAAEAAGPVRCSIKWPNDVWVERSKLAGILVEGRPQAGWAVLGIGLNVADAPVEVPATSLDAHGGTASAEQVTALLVESLGRWIPAASEAVLAAWRERDALLGERVRWRDGEGVAGGIDDAGALLVDTGAGRVALEAGEVHLLR
jgi:BirA family biotin operon repressor/biotin-[acetyl-CoA-carboxylase] ligase